MLPLPIDAVLPELERALRGARAVVLEAPPGAGKTTRVPWAVQEWLAGSEVVVAEPRRLAARMAAKRVADERAEVLGERVGYSVRFEEVSSARTRIRYATEGIVLRRLLSDPKLTGVGAVILDEFHERHLATDLLLVLLDRLSRGARPDLKLLVMSATLDAEPVARYLGDCPRIRSEGRLFAVGIEFLPKADERPLDKQIVSAVRRAVNEEADGDVLVFLPGAGEIRRAATALEALAQEASLLVLPLHGDLPIAEQARAVEPAKQRKVVLATNVAESSVTVDGVTVVVDSGLARVAGYSPWSGLPTLGLEPVSRASTAQRAGRAGRTRPGRVFRLYTKGDHEGRRAHDLPEIVRSDLAEALLILHGAGVAQPEALSFLDDPPKARLDSAHQLLKLLGALADSGGLSELGQRLLRFPVAPRLARLLVEGERRGVAHEAALACALLSERDILLGSRTGFGSDRRQAFGARGPSDVLERLERYREAEDARFEAHRLRNFGLDARAVDGVRRTERQLARLVKDQRQGPGSMEAVESELQRCLLTAFPDRVARRKRRGERELILASGGVARLSETSVVIDAEFLLALDVEEQRGAGATSTTVRLASAIEPDWLLESFPDKVSLSDELEWNGSSERVERVEKMAFGAVVFDETRALAPPSPEASALLATAARRGSALDFSKNDAVLSLTQRLRLLREHFPDAGFPELDDSSVEATLSVICTGLRSFAELAKVDVASALLSGLDHNQRRLLDSETPERVRLPGGRSVDVHYEADRPPWIESRLQDFFGMPEGPRLCRGRIALTLHLLAPNQRAVQVTSDLAGFWLRHYPTVRRELMRKYPRHPWPEDGRTATPPEPKPARRH
ncbi:MAG TPA: ATP-dependent helicase HrpB [Polyangiaceae bacterium]|nr:ATP-dependent helicase HrpB [Polyangiaceae bacterium]